MGFIGHINVKDVQGLGVEGLRVEGLRGKMGTRAHCGAPRCTHHKQHAR